MHYGDRFWRDPCISFSFPTLVKVLSLILTLKSDLHLNICLPGRPLGMKLGLLWTCHHFHWLSSLTRVYHGKLQKQHLLKTQKHSVSTNRWFNCCSTAIWHSSSFNSFVLFDWRDSESLYERWAGMRALGWIWWFGILQRGHGWNECVSVVSLYVLAQRCRLHSRSIKHRLLGVTVFFTHTQTHVFVAPHIWDRLTLRVCESSQVKVNLKEKFCDPLTSSYSDRIRLLGHNPNIQNYSQGAGQTGQSSDMIGLQSLPLHVTTNHSVLSFF